MPTKQLAQKKEKRNLKEEFLGFIEKNYGLGNAVVMEDALSEQKKQLQFAMHTGGMSLDNIAESRGIDLLGSLIKNKENKEPTAQAQQTPEASGTGLESLAKLLPAQGLTSPAQVTPEGNIQQGGALSWIGRQSTGDLIKKLVYLSQIQQRQGGGTKGVYGFDPATGKVTHEANIPEGSELRVKQASTGIESLAPEERPIARALARKLYGVRGAEKGIKDVIDARNTGLSFDKIEDSIG